MLEIRGLLNVTLLLNVKQLMLSRQSLSQQVVNGALQCKTKYNCRRHGENVC